MSKQSLENRFRFWPWAHELSWSASCNPKVSHWPFATPSPPSRVMTNRYYQVWDVSKHVDLRVNLGIVEHETERERERRRHIAKWQERLRWKVWATRRRLMKIGSQKQFMADANWHKDENDKVPKTRYPSTVLCFSFPSLPRSRARHCAATHHQCSMQSYAVSRYASRAIRPSQITMARRRRKNDLNNRHQDCSTRVWWRPYCPESKHVWRPITCTCLRCCCRLPPAPKCKKLCAKRPSHKKRGMGCPASTVQQDLGRYSAWWANPSNARSHLRALYNMSPIAAAQECEVSWSCCVSWSARPSAATAPGNSAPSQPASKFRELWRQ